MNALDNDFYQFTMSQWAKKYWSNLEVCYKFKNRSSIGLLEHISLNEVKDLIVEILDSFETTDFSWLEKVMGNQRVFGPKYLKNITVKDVYVRVFEEANELAIEYVGPWWQAMLLETPILAAVNELYFSKLKDERYRLDSTLGMKIGWLKEDPIKFFEFGTRRRYSYAMQVHCLAMLKQEVPDCLLGTSNVRLAKMFDLELKGTTAHQMFMVPVAMGLSDVEAMHQDTITTWNKMYEGLAVYLTDTYGSDWFFQNIKCKFDGLRQDSGDPIQWFHKALKYLESLQIDPKDKLLCFSDGLTLYKMHSIREHTKKYTDNIAFGWGTNLTGSQAALSLVIKPCMVQRQGCVKLSDNIAKAMGTPRDIAKYKEVFKYKNNYRETCKY